MAFRCTVRGGVVTALIVVLAACSTIEEPDALAPTVAAVSGSAVAPGREAGSGTGDPSPGVRAAGAMVLDFDRLGPARIGTRVTRVATLLGHRASAPGASDNSCWERDFAGLAVFAMVLGSDPGGRVSRFSVLKGPGTSTIRTAKGIRLGSTDRQVLAAYPGAKVTTAPYDERPAAQIVARRGKHALLFITDGSRRVTQMRSGLREPVGFMEGCL